MRRSACILAMLTLLAAAAAAAASPVPPPLDFYLDVKRMADVCRSKLSVFMAPMVLDIEQELDGAVDQFDATWRLMLKYPFNASEGGMGLSFCYPELNAVILKELFQPTEEDLFSGFTTYANEVGVVAVGYETPETGFALLYLRAVPKNIDPSKIFPGVPRELFGNGGGLTHGSYTAFADWLVGFATSRGQFKGKPFLNYADCVTRQVCRHEMNGVSTTVTAGPVTVKFSADRGVIYDVVMSSPYLKEAFFTPPRVVARLTELEDPMTNNDLPAHEVVKLQGTPFLDRLMQVRRVLLHEQASCKLVSSELLDESLPGVALRDVFACDATAPRLTVVHSSFRIMPSNLDADSFEPPLVMFASAQPAVAFDFDRLEVTNRKLCAVLAEKRVCVGDEIRNEGWRYQAGELELLTDQWSYQAVELPLAPSTDPTELSAQSALIASQGWAGILFGNSKVLGFWERVRPDVVQTDLAANGYNDLGQLFHSTLIDSDLPVDATVHAYGRIRPDHVPEYLVLRDDQLSGRSTIRYLYYGTDLLPE